MFQETAEEAIIRETKEEIGLSIRVKRLVCIHENFFDVEDLGNNHEVSFYYLVEPVHEEDLKKPFLKTPLEEAVWIPVSYTHLMEDKSVVRTTYIGTAKCRFFSSREAVTLASSYFHIHNDEISMLEN